MDFSTERIKAIIRLLVMLATTAAGGFGLTIDPDSLGTIAFCVAALAAGIYAWWKNNNITDAAQAAQGYLDEIKGDSNA